MNKVFKALQQAERDRALADQPREEARSVPARPPVAEQPRRPAGAPAPPRQDAQPAAVHGTDGVEPHLVSLLDPSSVACEQYRTLRYVVEQAHREEKVTVLAVSAPSSGDGKTTTAINLAGTLAQASGRRVLLVDADLRRPAMASRLGLHDRGRGLVDAILDPTLALADVVEALPSFNLCAVPAGPQASSPYEVLQSPRLGQLLEAARAQYDYVVIDTPPLLPVPDCRIIAKHVDAFLLVVTAHRTRTALFDEAVNVLRASKVLGVVFNGSDDAEVRGYYGVSYYTTPDSSGNGAEERPWYSAAGHLGRLGQRWTKSHKRDAQ
jgi:capsular exopolysaccharide synthesis family protein